jgi:hypothetical protein
VTALEHANPLHLVRAPRQSGAQTPAGSDELRLQWRDPGVADGFIDGGWWPHSLDLRVELPALLAAFWSAGHEVTRVAYHPVEWAPAPRRLTGPGYMVTLDGVGSQEPALLSLLDASGATRTDLVVIPPRTDPRIARRVLGLARLGGDLHRLTGMLGRADRQPLAARGHVSPSGSLLTAAREIGGGRSLAA